VYNRVLISILILSGTLAVKAQEVSVVAHFSSDSIKLGEPIGFAVSTQYPSTLQVLLPDSTYSFAPFEFQKKIYYPTHTKNGISKDSVLYLLSTYEIDSIQILKIPAFVVMPNDCTLYESNLDTVYFKRLVDHLPDSLKAEELPLKTNTNYNPVSWLFNYPVFSIIAGALIAMAMLAWLLFGKKIKRYFTIKRLTKNHYEFIIHFDTAIEKLKSSFTPEYAEQSILVWKNYMEELVTKPYTKSTTRELKEIEKNEMLVNALHVIDQSIYGRIPPETLDSFLNLKDFSQLQFNKKIEALKHG